MNLAKKYAKYRNKGVEMLPLVIVYFGQKALFIKISFGNTSFFKRILGLVNLQLVKE